GSVAAGWTTLWAAVPAERQTLIPHDSAGAVVGWIGVLAIGSLGNLPGQDLMQRIFASRSARTASAACVLAGVAYLLLGALPILVGLAADVVAPQTQGESTLTALAGLFLSPVMSTVLLLAVVSAVLSTIDSAILSPASVLSENLFGARTKPPEQRLAASRRAVALVATVSCVVAYLGADAYELLESAYALGLVSLLVPLLGGVWGRRADERAALASMAVGTGTWVLHMVLGWESFAQPLLAPAALPVALCSMLVAAGVYAIQERRSG
ncbi:MAG: sodium:solute symporter, partial [Myxococcota bacterium]